MSEMFDKHVEQVITALREAQESYRKGDMKRVKYNLIETSAMLRSVQTTFLVEELKNHQKGRVV